MRLFRNFRSHFIFLLITLIPVMAGATYRADYFDLKKKPQIKFEKATKTWTLSNGEIERVIRFDTKTGSLKTTRFRNLKNGLELVSTLGSEAEISFVAQLRETPKPLTGWRATDKKPADNWTAPDFDAKLWAEANYATNGGTISGEGWFRAEIPQDRFRSDRAYALVLVQPLLDGGEVYVDGEKVLETKHGFSDRPCQFDLSPNRHVIAIHCHSNQDILPEARFVGIAEEGTAPPNLDLKQNWRYMIHAINTGQDNSLILSITLSGEKQFQGFELEINYQIHAGGEPTMAKWMYLISHRPTRFLLEKVTSDRWKTRVPFPEPEWGKTLTPASDFLNFTVGKHEGLFSTMMSRSGGASVANGEIVTQAAPGILVKPDARLELPRSLIALYSGSLETGKFLYQLYQGQYLVRGKPGVLPVTFVAETPSVGDSALKDAKAIEAQIPIAAELGIQTFVAGNGWQTTLTGNPGGYGDWTADRKFYPNGLVAFSLQVREAKMNFGLWLDPARVSVNSKAFADHPNWLVQRADGSTQEEKAGYAIIEHYTPPHSPYPVMCLPSGWMSSLSLSMAAFLKELSATTLMTSGDPFEGICLNPGHEHPLLYAIPAQEEQWKLFTEKIHGVNDSLVILSDDLDSNTDSALTDGGESRTRTVPAFIRMSDFGELHLFDDAEINLEKFARETFGAGRTPRLTGDLTKLTSEGRAELTKWITIYQRARPWLAYSANVTFEKNWQGTLFLRPALEDRYGYIYLTDAISRNSKLSLPIEINASDYFVHLDMSRLELVSVRTNKPVPFVKKENGFVLTNSRSDTDPATSWDLIEIRNKKPSTSLP